MSCSGLKLARRRPNECSFCSHCASLTSVLRPGTFFASLALTRITMKVASETLKSSDRLGVSIRWNGDYVEFSANINARSMRMDNRHSGGFFHGNLLAHFSMNEGGDDGEITFLNGIKVTIAGSATVPEPCFFTGSYHQKADGCFLR